MIFGKIYRYTSQLPATLLAVLNFSPQFFSNFASMRSASNLIASRYHQPTILMGDLTGELCSVFMPASSATFFFDKMRPLRRFLRSWTFKTCFNNISPQLSLSNPLRISYLFKWPFHNKSNRGHVSLLSNAVNACQSLLLHRRIPLRFQEIRTRCHRQVDPDYDL